MALENPNKPEIMPSTKPRNWVLLLLRLVAFCATASATVVMALNKQTKSFVVATVGSTPIKATFTAKFEDTPSFVFFVITNGLVSLHNVLMIAVSTLGKKLDSKGSLTLAMIATLDMLNVALVSGGASAAAFMAELGKNGNSHAQWDKICDKFETFCNHGGGALIASYSGLALMLAIATMSIFKLLKPKSTHQALDP